MPPVKHTRIHRHSRFALQYETVSSNLARPLSYLVCKDMSLSAQLCLIMCMCECAGRWEARIGIPAKVYLGLFSMETEAAQAYDRALVRLRGTAAATNFALSDYRTDLAAYHKMQQVRMDSQ